MIPNFIGADIVLSMNLEPPESINADQGEIGYSGTHSSDHSLSA